MDNGILYVVSNKWIRNPETNEMPYKIGITRGSVDDRYYGLGLKMPGKFETLFAYKFDDCAKAEQLIHGILNKKRENGEWFNINQKELDHIKATCELMAGILVTDEVENEIETETGIKIESEIVKINEIETEKENKIVAEMTGKDLLQMEIGDTVSDFLNLIVNSKKPNSENWAGEEYKIKNTPMKGINWIGNDEKPLAVIIRTTGRYKEDNVEKYAFEAKYDKKNKTRKIDKNIKSNKVLINQLKYKYPILYFIKKGSKYELIGKFSVDKVFET